MSRPTAFSSAGTSSSLRQSSINPLSSQQSSPLAARIASKKLELENLRQLRDVSGALASQMEELGEKLATLKDGTEGWLACIFPPWMNEKILSGAKKKLTIDVNQRWHMLWLIGAMFSVQSAWHPVSSRK